MSQYKKEYYDLPADQRAIMANLVLKEETETRTARVLMAMTELEAAALALLEVIDHEREAMRESVSGP